MKNKIPANSIYKNNILYIMCNYSAFINNVSYDALIQRGIYDLYFLTLSSIIVSIDLYYIHGLINPKDQ